MGERHFFELIQRNTGIDLVHCDGKPNTDWSPNRRQNRQTAAAIGKPYDDPPPQTVIPAAIDDSRYNSTTIAAGPNQTSPHNVVSVQRTHIRDYIQITKKKEITSFKTPEGELFFKPFQKMGNNRGRRISRVRGTGMVSVFGGPINFQIEIRHFGGSENF